MRDLFKLIQTPRYRIEERCKDGVMDTVVVPVVKEIGVGDEMPFESYCMDNLAVVISSALKLLTRMLVKE